MRFTGEYALKNGKCDEFLFAMYEQYVSMKRTGDNLSRILPSKYWEEIERWIIENNLQDKVDDCYKKPL